VGHSTVYIGIKDYLLSLSLHFNFRFPGEPGLASVYWS